MVARPPLKVRIERMGVDDVPAVHKIESASFPTPWPDYAFRQELQTNRLAHYLIVKVGRETIAYGGLWLMVDEAHITTIAVLPEWRRHGIGGRLMLGLMDVALLLNARVVTLEVRLSDEWLVPERKSVTVHFDPENDHSGFISADKKGEKARSALEIAAPEVWSALLLQSALARVQKAAVSETELVRATLRARDEERRHIARELHDEARPFRAGAGCAMPAMLAMNSGPAISAKSLRPIRA